MLLILFSLIVATVAAFTAVAVVKVDSDVAAVLFYLTFTLSHIPVCGSHPPVVQSHVILHEWIPNMLMGQPKK